MPSELRLQPIGSVRQDGPGARLLLEEAFRPALRELDRFSHILVLWWASGHDDPESRSILQTELPYAPGTTAGVFACRAEYRPNPIAVSVCPLTSVDEASGEVGVGAIDAFDGSPLLDIKPYIGVVDRVADVVVPDWFDGWPEWLPEEGIGLSED